MLAIKGLRKSDNSLVHPHISQFSLIYHQKCNWGNFKILLKILNVCFDILQIFRDKSHICKLTQKDLTQELPGNLDVSIDFIQIFAGKSHIIKLTSSNFTILFFTCCHYASSKPNESKIYALTTFLSWSFNALILCESSKLFQKSFSHTRGILSRGVKHIQHS